MLKRSIKTRSTSSICNQTPYESSEHINVTGSCTSLINNDLPSDRESNSNTKHDKNDDIAPSSVVNSPPCTPECPNGPRVLETCIPRQRDLSSISTREQDFENGYDSNGNIGPFYDCIDEEGKQDYDEDNDLLQVSLEPDLEEGSEEDEDAVASIMTEVMLEHIHITEDELIKYGVSMLKDELKKRGAAIYGTKEQFRVRLRHAIDRKVPIGGNDKAKNRKRASEKVT